MTEISRDQLIRGSFVELMKNVGTSIPGHITGFDAATQLAQVQIGIEILTVAGDSATPSVIVEVPVYQPGGKYIVEFEVSPGDEGLVVFSQRTIDSWRETGGVANLSPVRFHDMSDALFFPGFRSAPNAIPAHANNGVRLRNADGTQYVWLKNDGAISLSGLSVDIVTIDPNGLTHNGVNIGSPHTHGGVTPGSGTSGPVTPTP